MVVGRRGGGTDSAEPSQGAGGVFVCVGGVWSRRVVGDRHGGALEQDAVELGPQRPRQQPAACVCARA